MSYRSPGLEGELAAATSDLVDVYWDNVGGALLERCAAACG